MKPHPFQPLSAVLGVAVIVLGLLVAAFGLDDLGEDAAIWVSLTAVLIGVAMIPWRGQPAGPAAADDPTDLPEE